MILGFHGKGEYKGWGVLKLGPWKRRVFLPHSSHCRDHGPQLFVLQSLRCVNGPADPDFEVMYIHGPGRSMF